MELYSSLALIFYMELSRIGGSRKALVEYRSFYIGNLTHTDCKRQRGHCLVGSLTGEVAC
jgi:hypothetical protein